MPPIEATDETFETAVLERSVDVTVVVDLWATWCGPCLTLGPLLERVVAEADGVELVKVDVDRNPRTSASFQVQSIPAVFAVRNREVIDSFIGALPEPALRQWVAGLNPEPTEVQVLLAKGDEQSLREALDLEPANDQVLLALAARLVSDAPHEALALIAKVPDSAESRHIAAQARLGTSGGGAGGGNEIELRLDSLLGKVKDDEQARQEFLDLLEVLGPDDPRTAAYRKALTARLF
jgi:putative thioredoxin